MMGASNTDIATSTTSQCRLSASTPFQRTQATRAFRTVSNQAFRTVNFRPFRREDIRRAHSISTLNFSKGISVYRKFHASASCSDGQIENRCIMSMEQGTGVVHAETRGVHSISALDVPKGISIYCRVQVGVSCNHSPIENGCMMQVQSDAQWSVGRWRNDMAGRGSGS